MTSSPETDAPTPGAGGSTRLTVDRAVAIVRECLGGPTTRRIGAEVEWLVFDRSRPERRVTADETAHVATGPGLPAGGTITVEPGGQVELSTVAVDDPMALVDAIDLDAAVLVDRFARRNLALVPLGIDPVRPAVQTLDAPRYRIMEQYFRSRSPEGLRMMASTAALQLSVDPGPRPGRTWKLLGAVAPVLSALFANSGDDVLRSERQRVWAATDPTRTSPVPTADSAAWVDHVLDAPVMLRADGDSVAAPMADHTFRTWLADAVDPPCTADLHVHLTTMFPPVRPRGHIEIRCIDAVPRPGRLAVIGVVWALVHDDEVGEVASAACAALGDGWRRALDDGLADRGLLAVGVDLLDRAEQSLEKQAPALSDACRSWRATRLAAATNVGRTRRGTHEVATLLDDLAEPPAAHS